MKEKTKNGTQVAATAGGQDQTGFIAEHLTFAFGVGVHQHHVCDIVAVFDIKEMQLFFRHSQILKGLVFCQGIVFTIALAGL